MLQLNMKNYMEISLIESKTNNIRPSNLSIRLNKNILNIIFQLCLIFSFFYIKSFYIIFFAYVFFTFIEGKQFIYSSLPLVPILELLSPVTSGITVTRLILLFSTGYLLFTKNFKTKVDKICIICLLISIFYLFSPLVGLINGNIAKLDLIFPRMLTSTKALDNSISAFMKVICAIILYLSLKEDKKFDINNFSITMSISILLIAIQSIARGITAEGSWFNVATRYSFLYTDPNEFSVMLGTLSIFALHSVVKSKGFMRIISVLSYISVLWIVSFSLSRQGLLTYILALVVFVIWSDSFKRLYHRYFFILTVILLILLFIFLNLINIQPLQSRFDPKYTGGTLYGITSGRTDFYKPAFLAFLEHPVFGWGPNGFRLANYYYSGITSVSHNSFLQVLVNYGGICFILWIFLLYLTLFRVKESNNLFKLAFIVLMLSSLSLDWAEKDFLWIMWGLTLGITSSGSGSNWSVFAHKNNWQHRLFF